MAMVPRLTAENIKKWFEEGKLPASFSQKPVWPVIMTKLDHFERERAQRSSVITDAHQKKIQASQAVQDTQMTIQALTEKLANLQEEEKFHAAAEQSLQAEFEEWQMLDVSALKAFARLAAQVEKKLVTQLEDQLAGNREGLLDLHQKGGPKLSLLLSCFGATPQTIQLLADLDGLDVQPGDDLEPLIATLPEDQQIVVLYTQERLCFGKVPFAHHDCALCDCETPEEMAAFLQELGIPEVTANCIRESGTSGRGSLLFWSPPLEKDQLRLLQKARADHRNV